MIFKRTAAGIILAGLMLGMTGCGSTGNDGATENTNESSLIEKTDGGAWMCGDGRAGGMLCRKEKRGIHRHYRR